MANSLGRFYNKNGTFQYCVTLFAPSEKYGFEDVKSSATAPKVTVPFGDVDRLEYVNDMMNFLLSGSLVITDRSNSMPLFMSFPYVYCQVDFFRVAEGNKPDTASAFSQVFIVNQIDVISRVEMFFSYRLSFVSIDWWKFMSNYTYSNYKSDSQESAVDMLVKLFRSIDLPFNTNGVNSFRKFSYISGVNDTAMDTIRALLSKSYISKEDFQNGSLHFIAYDDIAKAYNCIKLNSQSTYVKQFANDQDKVETIPVTIAGLIDVMLSGRGVNFTSSNSYSKLDLIKSIRDRLVTTYDYAEDKFKFADDVNQNADDPNVISDANIMNVINTVRPSSSTTSKFFSKSTTGKNVKPSSYYMHKGFSSSCAEWFNDTNYQSTELALLTGSDTIDIIVDGSITRKPGIEINVAFDDREEQHIKDIEKIDEYVALKTKYTGLIGKWLVTSVKHVITPSSYTNSISLARNFKYK